MNPAVRQAIEARLTQVDAEIQSATEVLTTHVTTMNDAKAQMDEWTHKLHVLELERDELAQALPEEPAPEPAIQDKEPSE